LAAHAGVATLVRSLSTHQHMSTHGDVIDRANERVQTHNDDSIAEVRRHIADQAAHPSAMECADCGTTIPEARRQAVPGVTLCIDCATAAEYAARVGVRP
jgi:phage/conjugal plasmid C-4 type zinc finger TraR family protein